ncbi:MAG: BPL-N domain-containing protein [Chlamydiales bacterium]|nr:BPL-N domain-containing protein [Chlamydiales bacterium]
MTFLISQKRGREEFEAPPKKILLYQDEGTCDSSMQAIYNQLQKSIQDSFCTEIVDSTYLKRNSWQDYTFAIVMGGGKCSSWEHSLGTEGMLSIRNFVSKGGRYLGICAGAYFAATTSIFRPLGQEQIIKQRPLAFFAGSAIGPLNASTHHLSPHAALAVKVDLLSQNIKGHCYYLGGCAFNIHEDTETTRILARFCKPYKTHGSAIISCAFGTGKAVLCGLHPEFFWQKIPHPNKDIELLSETLSEQEHFRQQLWTSMLHELM